jgi:hypothetical protein
MATLIKPDGTQTEVKPKNGKTFTLKELQTLVGGYVARSYLGCGKAAYLDEDAFLRGLPSNLIASVQISRQIGQIPVYGNALIVDKLEEEE